MDDTEVKPNEKTKLINRLHREFTEDALLDNSPAEKPLKNLAGKDNNLDITAASTDNEVLVETLVVIIPCIADNS